MLLQNLPLKELVQCRELSTNHGLPTIVGQMEDATVAFFATEATHALLCVHCIAAFFVYYLNWLGTSSVLSPNNCGATCHNCQMKKRLLLCAGDFS